MINDGITYQINMAEAVLPKKDEHGEHEVGLKCRQCRSGFLVESKESHDLVSSTTDLYLIKDDALPDWISDKIEEVSHSLPQIRLLEHPLTGAIF